MREMWNIQSVTVGYCVGRIQSRGETKLGFVPGSENETLALMFFYGHSDCFELRVLQVSPDKNPWEQVRVGLYVTDAHSEGAKE